jgi:hypothetical protein
MVAAVELLILLCILEGFGGGVGVRTYRQLDNSTGDGLFSRRFGLKVRLRTQPVINQFARIIEHRPESGELMSQPSSPVFLPGPSTSSLRI